MRGAPELAEGIATFALVFVGAGAIMVDAVTGGTVTHVGVSITFGLVIAAMVYATGHVSGAHINPAVTLAFAATGHFPWRRVPTYIAAQATGAVLAALLLRALLGTAGGLGATSPHPVLPGWGLWTVEILITALLMFVIASVATDGRAVAPMAGVAIGSTVALMALFAGPLTGASMNPARTLGPAIASGSLAWVPHYLVATFAGAGLGAFAYDRIRRGDRPRRVPAAEVVAEPVEETA